MQQQQQQIFCFKLNVNQRSKMEDEEEQKNELLALEAIYGKNVFIRSNEEPGGELKIHILIDQPFTVCFEAGDEKGNSELDAKRELPKVDLGFLPPLVLNFSYPADYPSSSPPLFALSCKWLNEIQVRNWFSPCNKPLKPSLGNCDNCTHGVDRRRGVMGLLLVLLV